MLAKFYSLSSKVYLPWFSVYFFLISLSATAQIQTNSAKKAGRIIKKEFFRSLSNQNGWYLIPQFGMRYGEYIDDQYSGIQDLSIYYGLGLGFRKNNLSLESGLSGYHHTVPLEYIPKFQNSIGLPGTESPSVTIPFTFRYDIPTGQQQMIRIGAFLTSNWTILASDSGWDRTIRKISTSEGEQFYYILSLVQKNPFFFKTGIHSRLRLANSSYFIVEFGQFFTLGPNRLYKFAPSNTSPINISRRWEGFTWSIGGVLPISVWQNKLSKGG